MLVSTKGRYALRIMLDLAQYQGDSYVPMKEVASRQGLSLKYIEKIMPQLSKNGFVDGVHGKGGGYRLSRPLDEYRVGDILRLAEGDLAPVACLECSAEPCERSDSCMTRPMWQQLYTLVNDYFDGITLADLAKNGSAASAQL